MTLKLQLTELQTELGAQGVMTGVRKVQAAALIGAAIAAIPADAPSVRHTEDSSGFTRKENTPTRVQVSNWTLGKCKRCGMQGADDGSWIVKIFGTGWWHDACYRIINPDFYRGM